MIRQRSTTDPSHHAMISALRLLIRLLWNSPERRLRAFWRLAMQVLLFTGLLFAIAYNGGYLADRLGVRHLLGISGLPPETAGLLSQFTAILISLAVAVRLLDRRPFGDLGLHLSRAWWLDLGFGLLLGAFLMTLIFGLEWAAGWIRVTGFFHVEQPLPSFGVSILGALLLFLLVALQEELWTRGYQLRNLSEGLNLPYWGPTGAVIAAWVGSSVLFGLLHAENPNATLISTVNLSLAGLFLGLGYVLTGELAIPMGVHLTWNFFQGNVFGFPVSGLTVNRVTLIAVEQGGPELWTGGPFGPEAGLIGIGAILLGSGLTCAWVRLRRGELRLVTRLAVYTPRV